ncbi:hypothetical protein HJC23_008686 [Cyclotella cryptica]|uniref:CDP-diacylglycerol--glycerol-3-phosphate 3-phosphatidyltransferase n=1 Tax=Cyclotella cryptica TaxID=29204 RepID=A0ABD3QIC2_9STRA|eukprot:CCRYP_005402-RA/>CCRYP_005402-RA protein AED:0.00 eAED:0.00 QI:145/-1/1/1/-1/1/1/202/327
MNFIPPRRSSLLMMYASVSILLSSSVMSSSFSPSTSSFALVGRQRTSDDARERRSFLLRGGDIESHTDAQPASPPLEITAPPATELVTNTKSKLGPNAPPPGFLRTLLPSFPWHLVPNYLTYARCLSIPLFLILSYYPTNFPRRAPTLSAIFALASITDWWDGYLARRWDITSPFGAFLDPVADKLMVSTALIVLSGRYGGIVAIPSSIILAREVGVSALREWMAQRGKRESVKVGMQGKVKAALTMMSISILLCVPEGIGLNSLGWTKLGALATGGTGNVVEGVKNVGIAKVLGPSLILLFMSAVITVTSGWVYFKAALPVLLGEE